MSKPRTRKPQSRSLVKPAPDPKLLLPKLRACLEKEQVSLDRWHKRLVRAFRAYERQHRLITCLARKISRLESA
jgi:hypothetical protein